MVPYHHLTRAAAILAGALLIFFVIRTFLIPSSFGQFGNFRGDNLAEQAGIPPAYGAPDSCAACHGELFKTKSHGKHAAVPCQTCHAPLSQHVTDDGISPMPVNRSFTLCARCHQKLEARPVQFPQISIGEHLSRKNLSTEGNEGVCLSCHNPHAPTPK